MLIFIACIEVLIDEENWNNFDIDSFWKHLSLWFVVDRNSTLFLAYNIDVLENHFSFVCQFNVLQFEYIQHIGPTNSCCENTQLTLIKISNRKSRKYDDVLRCVFVCSQTINVVSMGMHQWFSVSGEPKWMLFLPFSLFAAVHLMSSCFDCNSKTLTLFFNDGKCQIQTRTQTKKQHPNEL